MATGLLIAPTPDDSLLLNVMRLCTSASGRIAEAAGGAVASAFTTNLDLGKVVGNIAGVGFGLAGIGDFLVAIPILLAAIGFVYVLALYLLRIIQLVFAVASAPLFVAVAVYDHRNRFVQWWLDLFTSAMLLPVVLAVCGSLTAGIALFFLGGNQGGISVGGAAEGDGSRDAGVLRGARRRVDDRQGGSRACMALFQPRWHHRCRDRRVDHRHGTPQRRRRRVRRHEVGRTSSRAQGACSRH